MAATVRLQQQPFCKIGCLQIIGVDRQSWKAFEGAKRPTWKTRRSVRSVRLLFEHVTRCAFLRPFGQRCVFGPLKRLEHYMRSVTLDKS